jgi:acyl-coenzyme A thioesterase PaaI-like protein
MKKQASARNCFVCGVENVNGLQIRFYQAEPGKVVAECTIPKQYEGYPGIVHGGIISAVLDEVAGRTLTGDDPPRFMVTAQLSVRFRRPVPIEQPLQIFGYAKADRDRTAVAISEMRDKDNHLLAEAEVVLANIPPGLLSSEWDEREWMVYPDEEEHK